MPASDILMCPAPSPSLSTTMWGTFYPSPHDAAKNDSWIHHTNHNDLWTHDVLSSHNKDVVAHPPRHIPAFVASESTIRTIAGGSSTFDHVPLDVDKKMFRGSLRQQRHPPSNPKKKIQHHLQEEDEVRTQQAPPPRTITVVSPPPLSVTTTCRSEGRNDEDDERRMPPATLQVLETLWLDMEDGMDE